MLDELAGIPEALKDAALLEDAEQFTRLQMREVALKAEIREAELEPHRAAVERLQKEVLDLEAARVEALEAPPPPVPDHLRHTTTADMMKRRLVEGALRRSSGASRELAEARARLETAEKGVRGERHAMMTT
jgi:hypothetical protein